MVTRPSDGSSPYSQIPPAARLAPGAVAAARRRRRLVIEVSLSALLIGLLVVAAVTVLPSVSTSLTQAGTNSGALPSESGQVSEGDVPQQAQLAPGDLGLPTAISRPACNGSYAVFVGAAVEPTVYQSQVAQLLGRFPETSYLLAEENCSSLARQSNGNNIYAVYFGPFDDIRDACAQRARAGGDSYVRRLDNVTPVGQDIEC